MNRLNASKNGFVGAAARLLHRGAGQVAAVIAGHAEGEAQTVTLYDGLHAGAPVLLRLHLPAGALPCHFVFSTPLHFDLGLYVDPGGCDVHVTTIGEPLT